MGATWFHGTQLNPVYDLAVQYGLVATHTSKDTCNSQQPQQQQQEQPAQDAHFSPVTDLPAANTATTVACATTHAEASLSTLAVPVAASSEKAANPEDGRVKSATSISQAGSNAGIQAAQAGAGSDVRWEMRACRAGAAAPLSPPDMAVVLQAFQQYGAAVAGLEEAVPTPDTLAFSTAGRPTSGSGNLTLGQILRSRV